MSEITEREVNFDKYCPFCKHVEMAEEENPCKECLDTVTNNYTDRPVKYEPNGKS